MNILVKRNDIALPEYKTSESAGCDIRAKLDKPLMLYPNQRKLIPTGLFCNIPKGYEIQIRPRSGLAIDHGITVLNSIGTIDSDYTNEIKVILINLGEVPYQINDRDRIAQMVVSPIIQAQFSFVDEIIRDNDRGGGFGHTGVN